MKKLFKYEINESIAAQAAINCLKNRNNHKKLNETSEFDARFEFRKDLRELASPAAKKAYMIIRKQYGDGMWRQLCMDDCDEQGLIEMLNVYAEDGLKPQQIVNKIMGVQEQEESFATDDKKYKVARQLMANYNPDTDEWEDPTVWLRYAIQGHIGKQFLKLPKKEVKAWQKVIDETIAEYEFEKQHPAHYEDEDEDNLQSQLANAWDEGMENDEDDYVPYKNTFDETHNDIVDNLISAVEHYFDTDDDVSGFNHYDYTEDQIGKAVEKVLDKYGDFPSSNNFNKCYAWAKKHAEELMKILETGSLENTYEGHPEFDFYQEQEEMPQMERRDMILAITQVLDESFDVDDNDGDLDDIYYAVARFLNLMTYYTPESEDDIMDWCREWHEDIAEIINTPTDSNELKRFVDDAFECLLEEGGYPEFYDLPKEQVKQAIYKALCNTPESELPWGRHYAINAWTNANVQKIRKFLTRTGDLGSGFYQEQEENISAQNKKRKISKRNIVNYILPELKHLGIPLHREEIKQKAIRVIDDIINKNRDFPARLTWDYITDWVYKHMEELRDKIYNWDGRFDY